MTHARDRNSDRFVRSVDILANVCRMLVRVLHNETECILTDLESRVTLSGVFVRFDQVYEKAIHPPVHEKTIHRSMRKPSTDCRDHRKRAPFAKFPSLKKHKILFVRFRIYCSTSIRSVGGEG